MSDVNGRDGERVFFVGEETLPTNDGLLDQIRIASVTKLVGGVFAIVVSFSVSAADLRVRDDVVLSLRRPR